MTAPARLVASLAGRYAIEREVGVGGMATVYLAHDVKHDRDVALKVLKPELAAVLGAERFVAEIRTTAALQHPHILPLFDSGTADGFLFYVMPFVAGETLRDKLNRETQLAVDEAVRIAREVADALDYAHRHGVIHRDIKPENILLNDGRPMVADFGIALALSAAAGGRMTETGLSLGTPHYMSPEQATAEKEITARSDVYSLGSVLYEMLTGNPPHTGASAQQIIMKIITESVAPVTQLRKSVPPNVAAAIAKALEKLPADRFESAKAFADALGNPAYAPAVLFAGSASPVLRARRAREAALAGMVMAASAVAAWGWLREPVRQEPARFAVATPDSIELAGGRYGCYAVALSNDGTQLAFIGRANRGMAVWMTYVRRLSEPDARAVKGSENGHCPVFSPDGTRLLLVLPPKLIEVPVGGGEPLVVTDADAGSYASWGDRGEIVFSRSDGVLFRVSENGGEPVLLARPSRSNGESSYREPFILPGGRAALITILKTGGASELGTVTIPDGHVTDLGVPGLNPRYVTGGRVIFGQADGSVMVAPFSERSLRLTGAQLPVFQADVTGSTVQLSTSRNGTLAYMAGALPGRQLVAEDRSGAVRRLPSEERTFVDARISPDGRRIVVQISQSGLGGRPDLWVYDVASHALSRLTTDGVSARPVWTADGRSIAFIHADSGHYAIETVPWDGSAPPTVLTSIDRGASWRVSLGPPHSYYALQHTSPAHGRDIDIAPLDSPRALRPFVATAADEYLPAIAPDGKVLAYVSNETGRDEVYARPLPGPGARVQVSVEGGTEPVWAPDGHELFYRAQDHMNVATVTERPALAVAARTQLFPVAPPAEYDVFPGGRELLMITSGGGIDQLYVVVNWTEELRRRTSAERR